MAKALQGSSSVFDDDKMHDRLLFVVAQHFSTPLFQIEEVFRIMKSIDKTIAVLCLAENKKMPVVAFAHQHKEVPYVLPLTRG